MDQSRYWSYVGDRPEEAVRVRRDVRRFLESEADPDRSDLDAAELVAGAVPDVGPVPGVVHNARLFPLRRFPKTRTVENRKIVFGPRRFTERAT